MSSADNVEVTKKGYAAFSAADLDGALNDFDDDIVWEQPGNSAISGTYRGKAEVGEFLTKVAGKSFTTTPSQFIGDGDTVIVLTEVSVAGESASGADVFTFRDGKIVTAKSLGDTALMERVFGTA